MAGKLGSSSLLEVHVSRLKKHFLLSQDAGFENNKNSTLSVTAVAQSEAGLGVAPLVYPFHKASEI